MKKLFFTLLAVVTLGVGSATAQVVWGVKAKVMMVSYEGYTTYTDRYITTYDGGYIGYWNREVAKTIGYQVGPVMYYSRNNRLYFSSEVMVKLIPSIDEYRINVPFFVGVNLNKGGKISPYIQVGPYVEFDLGYHGLFSDHYHDSYNIQSTGGPENLNIVPGMTVDHEGIDAGIQFVAGVNFGKFKIEAGGQFSLVFENLIRKDTSFNYPHIGVGYVF
jgi:hypothetical protein